MAGSAPRAGIARESKCSTETRSLGRGGRHSHGLARSGESFTVLYRSRPAFRIIGVRAADAARVPLEADPLYRAGALGRSKDGRAAADHDELLYGSP
jgi:hypothetical protein